MSIFRDSLATIVTASGGFVCGVTGQRRLADGGSGHGGGDVGKETVSGPVQVGSGQLIFLDGKRRCAWLGKRNAKESL